MKVISSLFFIVLYLRIPTYLLKYSFSDKYMILFNILFCDEEDISVLLTSRKFAENKNKKKWHLVLIQFFGICNLLGIDSIHIFRERNKVIFLQNNYFAENKICCSCKIKGTELIAVSNDLINKF